MENNKTYKGYKGFNADMTCRGYQYEVGKTYELPEGESIEVCGRGFHAIPDDESPLSVFNYYPPSGENGKPSRYCEVEVGGNTDLNDGKVSGSKITIGAEIGIPGLVKDHIEWVKRNLIDDDEHKSSNTGDRSSASNTGDQSRAEVSGKDSVAIVTGKDCIAKGSIGCALFLTERNEDYRIVHVKAVIVDGKKVKADTWYKLVKGKLEEV